MYKYETINYNPIYQFCHFVELSYSPQKLLFGWTKFYNQNEIRKIDLDLKKKKQSQWVSEWEIERKLEEDSVDKIL